MKMLLGLIVAIVLLTGGFFALNSYIYNEKQGDMQNRTPEPVVDVLPIEHASAVISWDGRALYTDPTGDPARYAGQPAATIVLLTDIHGDHLSTSTLEAVRGGAIVVVPQAVQEKLPETIAARTVVLKNGENTTQAGFNITAVPMYNMPEATSSPHIKGRGNGYVVEKDGFRVYIAGDTGPTPEMKALSGIDIALVPMNLPYTMSVQDAAAAVLAFKPAHVYPYHYRGPDGLSDVNEFKRLVNAEDPNIDVVLLNWYPTAQ